MNSASAELQIDHETVQCNQVNATRDEGSATGSITYDFNDDQITLHNLQSNLDPTSLTTWIHPDLRKITKGFHFQALPNVRVNGTIGLRSNSSSGGARNLQIQIDSPKPFTFQFMGLEIPCNSGSGDLSINGGPEFAANGVINLAGAAIGNLPLFDALIQRLSSAGFRPPVSNAFGVQLRFQLDPGTFRVRDLDLANGPHLIRINGAIMKSGGMVDLTASFDNDQVRLHCTGTILDPNWQVNRR